MEELDNRFFNHGNMKEVNISSEMRDNFLSYSMSVIIDRALPDVRWYETGPSPCFMDDVLDGQYS